MKKKFLMGLLSVCLLFTGSANAATIMGFTTDVEDDSGFEIIDVGGSDRVLDFGSLTIVSAMHNGNNISEMLDAEILMDSVTIDISTESLLAIIGSTGFYSYSITSGTLIDDFAISVNNVIVLEADLTLTTLFSFGKAGQISPSLEINLSNVDLTLGSLDTETQDFLNEFSAGLDLVFALNANEDSIWAGLNAASGIGETVLTGSVGGNVTPVPEPITLFFMGWGALVLYALKKIGFWVKY